MAKLKTPSQPKPRKVVGLGGPKQRVAQSSPVVASKPSSVSPNARPKGEWKDPNPGTGAPDPFDDL